MTYFLQRVTYHTVLSITGFLFTYCCYANQQETWKIASLQWEPHSGSQLPEQGSAIAKLRALLKTHNIALKVDFLPWKRAIRVVQSDESYLGIYPAWPEDVFPHSITSPPIDCSTIAVFTQTDQFVTFKSIDDLFSQYNVGIISTYSYPYEIEQAVLANPERITRAHNESQLVKMLAAKRNNVAISDPKVMRFYTDKLNIHNIKHVADVENKELVVIMSDNDNNRLRAKRLETLTIQASQVTCSRIELGLPQKSGI